jgi:hypothetical protein
MLNAGFAEGNFVFLRCQFKLVSFWLAGICALGL